MNRYFFAGLGALLMSLMGCREVHHYGYKYIEQEMLNGVFGIDVVGGYGEEFEKDGKKLLEWGFPYNIHFDYRFEDDRNVSKLEIKNIQLVGKKTKEKYVVGDTQGENIRAYSGKKIIRVAVGPLLRDRYEYQDYELTATVYLYEAEEIMEESISVLLEMEYRKESRSDWFDKNTSI